MFFRNLLGNLIELNRYDYKNDHIYYKKVLEIKNLLNKNAKQFSYSKLAIQNALTK